MNFTASGCSVVDEKGFTILIAPHDFASKNLRAEDIAKIAAKRLTDYETLILAMEEVHAIASGEKQICNDDTEALALVDRIALAHLKNVALTP